MEKPEVLSPQSHGTEYYWDCIGPDLTELILSYLPIPSIIVAACVCKFWNSIIHSNSFKTRKNNHSWFFLSPQYWSYPDKNKLFAFIPDLDYWIELPRTTLLSRHPFAASMAWPLGGGAQLMLQHVLINKAYCQTQTIARPPNSSPVYIANRVITVGGIHLVKIKGSSLGVDLPESFEQGSSLCSALLKGKLYVYRLYLNWISCLDLEKLSWSDVKTIRPPGVVVALLVSCGDQLVLAGLCRGNLGYEFNIWRIDVETLEHSEVGTMPGELLSRFLDGLENKRFLRMKCVGFSNLVYVFGDQGTFACVCEMSDSVECRWRTVPNMPNCEHYNIVVSFSCDVSLDDFLGDGKTRLDS